MTKKKILFYGDSPTVATGFATVSRNILDNLSHSGKYNIDVFGINYMGTPHGAPYNIWPAMDPQSGDPYGRRKFCHFAMDHDFDILFIIQDTFIVDFIPELLSHLKQHRKTPFKVVMYYPIDSTLKEEWYNNIKDVDKLVAYTNFGKEALLAHDQSQNVDVIYHGANTKDFTELPAEEIKAFRKQFFAEQADKFIFANTNRNQQRKDIPRTIQAFKEFKKVVPESLLYLHMAKNDQGWNIPELCKSMGLSVAKDVVLPENLEPNQGYPLEIVNLLYNCSDCLISTTLGEGFGLSWLEAMATKTPVIMPNNTAMAELITEDKGYLAACGTNASLWTCVPNDNDIMRPLVDVDDLVKQMLNVYNNYEEAKVKAEVAYKWVHADMDWSGSIAKQWLKVFADLSKELDSTKVVDKINTIKSEEL